jgi:hypothetical protein
MLYSCSCVFRDTRGYPVFANDLNSGKIAQYYNQREYSPASTCMAA